MQITKISLTNIRCFKHLELDLSKQDGAKRWMVILGENGVGKTTLLRCIALGLCEQSGAAGLCAEIPGNWIHNGAEKGIIRIEILPYREYKGELAFVETTLEKADYDEVKLSQITSPRFSSTFNWEDLFVCGYGSARSVYGSMDVSEYAVTDSVYSLFNYDTDLQNPELCLRRLKDEKYDTTELIEKLETVLMINPGSISLNKSGIMVDGPWGKPMQIGTVGDGYKSTITWLLDLFGWKLLAQKHSSQLELEGIVIIDELEKHLHPKWQKQLIGLLSVHFPKIQFIISTHSPLCVIGTTELQDEDCCIVVLSQEENYIKFTTATPPRKKRVDQVLTSYLFELLTTSDDVIRESIQEYSRLYSIRQRSKEDDTKLQELKNLLEEELGSPETELEKQVSVAISETLASLASNASKKLAEDNPHNFEIKRQLKDIFKKADDKN